MELRRMRVPGGYCSRMKFTIFCPYSHSSESHILLRVRFVIFQLAGIFLAVEVEDDIIHSFADGGIVGQYLVSETCGRAVHISGRLRYR